MKEDLSTSGSDFQSDSDRLITETGESFRDRIATIDTKGKRVWVCPTKPKGKFHNYRMLVGYFLVSIFFIFPFIKIHDEPLLLLNVIERKFIIFGLPFWTQDFYIFALSFISLVIFIVLFTAIFGRIFCGWACPQTVFLELVYRKIEFLFEGDGNKQRKFRNSPLSAEKFIKIFLKQSIFLIISFSIANFFISYIITIDKVFNHLQHPFSSPSFLLALVGFTLVIWFVFAKFREQACIYVCPYGRLQSVLLDKNSIVINYDYKRGEPRGKISKKDNNSHKGDCIDCGACVRVCPTGIDIRNGVQLECVNCTACIDACDEMMLKVNKPPKLIKYASINQIEKNEGFKFTPRIILYSTVLLILISLVTVFTSFRDDVEATLLRAKGQNFQEYDNEHYSNLYTTKLVNKTFKDIVLDIKVKDIPHSIKIIGKDKIVVPKESVTEATFFVILPKSIVTKPNMDIKVEFYSDNKLIRTSKTSFSGPMLK